MLLVVVVAVEEVRIGRRSVAAQPDRRLPPSVGRIAGGQR